MPNLYLPVTANILSLVLIIIYFSKKRLILLENKIYIVMLFSILVDSFLVSSLFVSVYTNYNEQLVILLNKIDYLSLIVWSTSLFMYIFVVTYDKNSKFKKIYDIVLLCASVLNIIMYIIICKADIDIVLLDPLHQTAQGPAVNISIAFCLSYIILASMIALINIKNVTKKHLPVFIVIIISVIITCLFSFNPYLICISMGLTIVNMIMFFTIENPDLNILDEYTKNKKLTEVSIEARSDLLFRITEDVKTPIRKIKLFSDNILNSKKIEDKDINAKNIRDESLDLLNNINNVLNISNVNKKNIKLFDASYDFYNVYNQIIYIIKSKIGKNIDFKYSISDAIPDKLNGDSSIIKQIISSLLLYNIEDNADGLIDLDIYSITKYDICRLVITIRSSMCNLSLSDINDIISSDIEINDEKAKELAGLELDLKSIKKFIDILGGNFLITSDDNGTTFKVIINQLIEDNNFNKDLDKISKKLTNKSKILLVDDDYTELSKIANEFKNNNYYVESVMYGEDILDRLSSGECYDILVIDDEMQSTSAVDLIEKVDELECKDLVKIVMLDKKKESIKEHYIADYSFVDYLLKDSYKDEIKRIRDKYK